ncbi:hypothetical protein ABXN37_17945 [Piscinibacter sakaiensis]
MRLLDRHATPAAEASGNPAGIFHAIVHGHDGPHARFHRAAVQASSAPSPWRRWARSLAFSSFFCFLASSRWRFSYA